VAGSEAATNVTGEALVLAEAAGLALLEVPVVVSPLEILWR
jgi:hypothetical protein